ncbi:transcriptional repressor NrdR [Comamonas sp. BIGb0124]|mgnify:FL=1|uniref:transcriptional regulator NrdR n=1 Tax=Comamonas sp. BIGb0124 TaxID=2485130 RepID=UPI000F46A710|nr:transcriptional regulator NrdR [Comamonas sp. BIGb0124]ROR17002.1 transcriptional repressor NrdR [Comamonas sp. BIGb0124]
MKCPFCSHLETQVVETRVAEEGGFIRRRRQCGACDKRFTTYERPEVVMPQVIKKDGSRTDFDSGKIRASMALALRKRPVSIEQIDNAIDHIEHQVLSNGAREISSARLGDFVMDALKGLDKVGYVRFASVYRSFKDTDEFRRLLEEDL